MDVTNVVTTIFNFSMLLGIIIFYDMIIIMMKIVKTPDFCFFLFYRKGTREKKITTKGKRNEQEFNQFFIHISSINSCWC
jgi:hypothetical protein